MSARISFNRRTTPARKPFPVISGQDYDKVNVKAILNGEQTALVFKDTSKTPKSRLAPGTKAEFTFSVNEHFAEGA